MSSGVASEAIAEDFRAPESLRKRAREDFRAPDSGPTRNAKTPLPPPLDAIALDDALSLRPQELDAGLNPLRDPRPYAQQAEELRRLADQIRLRRREAARQHPGRSRGQLLRGHEIEGALAFLARSQKGEALRLLVPTPDEITAYRRELRHHPHHIEYPPPQPFAQPPLAEARPHPPRELVEMDRRLHPEHFGHALVELVRMRRLVEARSSQCE